MGVGDATRQEALLEGVSRTVALTIPTLPEDLRPVVGNAYLLCRIVDTVEDEPKLSPAQKKEFSEEFVRVVRGEGNAGAFSAALAPLLSPCGGPPSRAAEPCGPTGLFGWPFGWGGGDCRLRRCQRVRGGAM